MKIESGIWQYFAYEANGRVAMYVGRLIRVAKLKRIAPDTMQGTL